jgi:diguanylate cyclase (GGDEF)-like protein
MECEQFTITNDHCKAIKHILIIEKSVSLGSTLKESIDDYFSFSCDVSVCEDDARKVLTRKRYDLVIIDVALSDNTEIFIDEMVKNNLRVIAMTTNESEEFLAAIVALSIIDYVVKNDMKTVIDYLINTIERLNSNRNTLIGICDDSKVSRKIISRLVKLQNLPYIEFQDGQEAYSWIVEKKCKVDVLLSDYEMPRMNGIDLIRGVRHELLASELPIIALSASDKPRLTVQLLKAGASDYIQKPFTNEEFFIRMNLTLDQLYITRRNAALREALENLATHDFLTQLYNRNFFFTQIHHITADAIRQNKSYGILMIDIDHFKHVNDTYGHHAGDVAIVHIANILKNTARTSDYCMRWGGEEFLILVPHATKIELLQFAQRLLSSVEESKVVVEDENLTFSITVSIGGAIGLNEVSEPLILQADAMLYEAKNSGRNCVKI